MKYAFQAHKLNLFCNIAFVHYEQVILFQYKAPSIILLQDLLQVHLILFFITVEHNFEPLAYSHFL